MLKYALLGIFVPSALSKFVPGVMTKMWPSLPSWFWLPCGIWEAAGTYLVYTGDYEKGLPLMFSFLGGVMYAIMTLPMNKGKTMLQDVGPGAYVPAALGSGTVMIIADRAGINPVKTMVISMMVGWVIGSLMPLSVVERKKK